MQMCQNVTDRIGNDLALESQNVTLPLTQRLSTISSSSFWFFSDASYVQQICPVSHCTFFTGIFPFWKLDFAFFFVNTFLFSIYFFKYDSHGILL